ncbi:alkaline shock response membrane anchor protein AmaP [Nonomuraea gerenzanensis]|uniref:alkaline shock response membrane anchor protein AmaP n=1 Tax=Nonomuraea gerenzanensis TaxID=93944 RepID=UPI001CD931FD|nr:alkaline shock response membrane anchor protein AmaP [Nonomuraea gerenzanensis]UBU11918.1 alkaline shock response membrane anchor protein AmaP [Nonomuraea gerenzanensis]
MRVDRKTGRGNRWGLALVGLALVILGGSALARGLGAFSQNWAAARTTLVDGNVVAFFARNSPWIWWLLALAALVVAVLALRWLSVQGRRESRRTLRIEDGPTGVTEVSESGMAQAVAADVESSPAVLHAAAHLVGPHPEVRLRVVADESVPMEELSRHLATVALPHVRDALDRDRVPAVARVSLEPSPSPHRTVR